jgi:hypothetical protein
VADRGDGDLNSEQHALAAADAAGRALDAHIKDERLTLVEVIDSSAYPLEPGSAPDRFARRLAELVGGFPAEVDSPDLTDSEDVNVTVMPPDGSGRGVSITLDLPGEQGYGPVQEWRVAGSAAIDVGMELTLLSETDEPEFDHAIRMLQAHGALPENPP